MALIGAVHDGNPQSAKFKEQAVAAQVKQTDGGISARRGKAARMASFHVTSGPLDTASRPTTSQRNEPNGRPTWPPGPVRKQLLSPDLRKSACEVVGLWGSLSGVMKIA